MTPEREAAVDAFLEAYKAMEQKYGENFGVVLEDGKVVLVPPVIQKGVES